VPSRRNPAESGRSEATSPFEALLDSAAPKQRFNMREVRPSQRDDARPASDAFPGIAANPRVELKEHPAITEGSGKEQPSAGRQNALPDDFAPDAPEQQAVANAEVDVDLTGVVTVEMQTPPETVPLADTPDAANAHGEALAPVPTPLPAAAAPAHLVPATTQPSGKDISEIPSPAISIMPAPNAAAVLAPASRLGVAKGGVTFAESVEAKNAPRPDSNGEAKTEPRAASARMPAPIIATPETPEGDGERPRSGEPPFRIFRQVDIDVTEDAAGPARATPQTTSDPSASPQLKPEAGGQPASETAIPLRNPETKVRPQSEIETGGSGSLKGPENVLQTPGLATHASQTAVMHVTMSAAGSANSPGSVTPASHANAPVPLAGLALEIASSAHAGKHRFEIRLDPPELGRIDVRLDVDRDGNVTSRMTVDRAETLDLLKRDAVQLERALQQAGLKTSDNALEFSLRHQAFTRDDQTAQNAARLVVTSEDDPLPPEPSRQAHGRLIGLAGGVDIRV
jgi:hypothetical protein